MTRKGRPHDLINNTQGDGTRTDQGNLPHRVALMGSARLLGDTPVRVGGDGDLLVTEQGVLVEILGALQRIEALLEGALG